MWTFYSMKSPFFGLAEESILPDYPELGAELDNPPGCLNKANEVALLHTASISAPV